MKRLTWVFLLCALTAASGRGDEKLVEASKEAKAKRKKPATRVITNADVKKSRGTLIETSGTQAPVPPPGPTAEERRIALRKAEEAAAAQLAVLDAEIARVERELFAIEQTYYEENDLGRRDTDIVSRFQETKTRLAALRSERETIAAATAAAASGPAAAKPPAR